MIILLSINESILFWNYPKQVRDIVKGVSYLVTQVQHTFSKGKFTQELTCKINTFNNFSTNNPETYRSLDSDPNTNVGVERQTSDIRTAGAQAGSNEMETQNASYTGFKADPASIPVNPELGNQGGSSIQPPATEIYANGERDPGPSVVVAIGGGREPPETDLTSRNRLNASGLSGA